MKNSQVKEIYVLVGEILEKNPRWVPLSEREDFTQTLFVELLKGEARGVMWDPERGASLRTWIWISARRLSWKWSARELNRKLANNKFVEQQSARRSDPGDDFCGEYSLTDFLAKFARLSICDQMAFQADVSLVSEKKTRSRNIRVEEAANRLQKWHEEGGECYPVREPVELEGEGPIL